MKGGENVLFGDETPATPTPEAAVPTRIAQSYNPEIGLHNTKDIAAHLDNPKARVGGSFFGEAFLRQEHGFLFCQY